jgi:hypothetical protein
MPNFIYSIRQKNHDFLKKNAKVHAFLVQP